MFIFFENKKSERNNLLIKQHFPEIRTLKYEYSKIVLPMVVG